MIFCFLDVDWCGVIEVLNGMFDYVCLKIFGLKEENERDISEWV